MIAFLGASGAPECEAPECGKMLSIELHFSTATVFAFCILHSREGWGGVSAARLLCQCHFLVTFLP